MPSRWYQRTQTGPPHRGSQSCAGAWRYYTTCRAAECSQCHQSRHAIRGQRDLLSGVRVSRNGGKPAQTRHTSGATRQWCEYRVPEPAAHGDVATGEQYSRDCDPAMLWSSVGTVVCSGDSGVAYRAQSLDCVPDSTVGSAHSVWMDLDDMPLSPFPGFAHGSGHSSLAFARCENRDAFHRTADQSLAWLQDCGQHTRVSLLESHHHGCVDVRGYAHLRTLYRWDRGRHDVRRLSQSRRLTSFRRTCYSVLSLVESSCQSVLSIGRATDVRSIAWLSDASIIARGAI